jgi:hypothetical protein
MLSLAIRVLTIGRTRLFDVQNRALGDARWFRRIDRFRNVRDRRQRWPVTGPLYCRDAQFNEMDRSMATTLVDIVESQAGGVLDRAEDPVAVHLELASVRIGELAKCIYADVESAEPSAGLVGGGSWNCVVTAVSGLCWRFV